jgi:hypothetical protein
MDLDIYHIISKFRYILYIWIFPINSSYSQGQIIWYLSIKIREYSEHRKLMNHIQATISGI